MRPVLGDHAKRALRLTADWSSKRDRAVLVLLAAYSDAGEPRPLAREIAQRIGIKVRPDLDRILGKLAAGGLIWTVRRPKHRNLYVLRFAGELVPAEDRERFEAYERARQRPPGIAGIAGRGGSVGTACDPLVCDRLLTGRKIRPEGSR